MARVSDAQDQLDIERGTGSFLLPHAGDQDISTGCGSDKSGSGTDQSSLDPEQPCKPLIVDKYIINGNKIPDQKGLPADMKKGQQWGSGNGGNGSKPSKRKSIGVKAKICCLTGGVTFVAGIVLIIVAVLTINNKLISCNRGSSQNTGAIVSQENDTKGHRISDTDRFSHDASRQHSTSSQVKEEPKLPFTITVATSTTSQPMTFDHLVNLAAGGIAHQSSTFRNEEGTIFPASAAIDGSDLTKINSGSCSQTNAEEAPVWWIDMGSFQLVKRVRILQPSDCCGDSLGNFQIRVGQQKDLTTNVLCRDYMGTAMTSMVDIQCQRQIYGKYVSIQLLNQNNNKRKLSICEVAIYDR